VADANCPSACGDEGYSPSRLVAAGAKARAWRGAEAARLRGMLADCSGCREC
jgi:hypothetical protein